MKYCGFTPNLAWNQTSWSVSSEFFCYLIFPVVALVVNRTPRLAIIPFLALSSGNPLITVRDFNLSIIAGFGGNYPRLMITLYCY